MGRIKLVKKHLSPVLPMIPIKSTSPLKKINGMNADAGAHLKSSEKSKCERLPEKVLKEIHF